MNASLKGLGVIGDPIGHTLSPVIHNSMLKELGFPEIYEAVHVLPEELTGWVRTARETFSGFNATMPHKTALLPLMDELSDDASMYGAVNTVSVRGGRLFGHNTDGEGFLLSLKEHGMLPDKGRILVIGAGGAARSVSLKLASEPIEELTVCCREPQKASPIAAASPRIRIAPFSDLAKQAEHCDLLVNCTPLGMQGVSGQFNDFGFLDFLPDKAAVCDLIYRPLETRLLSEAKKRGHLAVNGLDMLIYQAILSLEQFLQLPLDIRRMHDVVENALSRELRKSPA